MEQKIGFKGTDENLKCRDTQFEVGKTYYIDEKNEVQELPEGLIVIKNKVKLCSKEALHYGNDLDIVFKHYPNNGRNRYFKIEIIGDFEDGGDKSGARCIKFLEEISKEEIARIKTEKEEEQTDRDMHLETVKLLQTKYPQLILGGSISLYIQGVRLKRFKGGYSDLDLISPYYTLIEESNDITATFDDEKGSGNDYDCTLSINGIKADVRIDPKERYEFVTYKDFKYKVIPLEKTIERKASYALKAGGQKHKEDLREMIINRK